MIQLPFDIQSIQEAYRNTENGTRGFYPIGGGHFWHAGIHIHSKEISSIKPFVSGYVAAYRIHKEYTKQDSPLELIRGEYERLNAVERAKYTNELSKYGMVFRFKDSVPQEQKQTLVSDTFVLLKHSYTLAHLHKSPLVFYTLYMNLAPAQEAGADAYDSRFVCDASVHIVSQKDSFYPKTIGSAGLDNGERYIDVALITEEPLFSYTEKSAAQNKPILLFDRLEKTIPIYTAIKREAQTNSRYITSGSRFTVLQTDSSTAGTAVKIQIQSVYAYLPSGSMGSAIAVGKKETVTNTHFILLCDSTHKIDFTTNTTNDSDCEYLKDCLREHYTNYKNTKKTITKIAGTQPQIEIVFDELGITDKPTFWLIATSLINTTTNTFNSNGRFSAYDENPLACDFSAVTLTDEQKEKITGCTDVFATDTAQLRYRKVQDTEYYITEADAQNCYKSAFDWKAWFIDTTGKTGSSTGILCDRTEVLKNSDDVQFLSEILNGEKRLSSIKHKYIFGGGELFEHAPRIRKGMRKLLCTHPLERDESLFSNIKKDYDACAFVGFQTETQELNLQASAQALDIWKGALQKIFKTNKLHFAHPIYFLHHLDRAGVFEFNPYLKMSYDFNNVINASEAGDHLESKHIEIQSNPGFAPLAGMNATEYVKYRDKNFAQCSSPFLINRYSVNANNNTLRHTGIDLAPGGSIDGRKTDIISFINGTVWAYTYDPITYGNVMIIKNDENNFLYILAHVSSKIKNVDEKVYVGDAVAKTGGVGGELSTGTKIMYGIHLHLEIRICPENDKNEVLDENENKEPGTPNGTFKWAENFKNTYPGPKRINPFNHTEEYHNNQESI